VTGWEGEVYKENFVGKAVYADMERTGDIETGHRKVNRLFLNALWGQKSNSIDFPTDCPQRDERLGWTGDAQVFSGTASYNMDTQAFYNKFIHDLRTEQTRLDGIVPGVIPVWDKNAAIFSCVWGDIGTFLPTVVYEHYGDKNTLEKHYPMMKDWVDKIDREDEKRGHNYLFNFENQLGDWLALDGRTEQSNEGGTDTYFIASCYYCASAKKTADAARILGLDEDARYYEVLSNKIKKAVINEYFTASGRLAIDTQTGYIVALHFGIYPNKDRVIEGLKQRLYKDCYKLKGGFVGAPLMCRVLAENGLEEEAFYFLLQEGYPGWLHCVDLGATTIWERWNSVLDNGKLSGTTMNSLNHYSFGAVIEFLYRDVAGLKPIEGGFRKVEISPLVNQKLHYMKMHYESVYGTYRVEWEILKNGQVHVIIEIPFGCSGFVGLPFYPKENVGEISAGIYEYTYMPTEDLRTRYTKKTLFKDMMQDEQAMKVIERVSPLLQYFLGSGNQDFLYESLTTLNNLFYMGFSKEMIDNLTSELMKIYEEG
jgi:alpha-L-rhamnosidase